MAINKSDSLSNKCCVPKNSGFQLSVKESSRRRGEDRHPGSAGSSREELRCRVGAAAGMTGWGVCRHLCVPPPASCSASLGMVSYCRWCTWQDSSPPRLECVPEPQPWAGFFCLFKNVSTPSPSHVLLSEIFFL